MTSLRAAPAAQRLPLQLANPPEEKALASLSAGDGVPPSHHPFAVKAEGGAPFMVLQLERVSPLRFQSSLLGAWAHPAPDVNVVRSLHPFRQGLKTMLPENPDADRSDPAQLISGRVLPT